MLDQIEIVGMLCLKGVFVPIIGMLLAYASVHVPTWLGALSKNARVSGVLERLGQLAMAVVQETEQTVVSKLGDTADEATLRAARDQTIATLKSHLGDKGLKEIETVLGLQDQDAVIKLLITFIEQAVHAIKPPAPPAVAIDTVIAPKPTVIAPVA